MVKFVTSQSSCLKIDLVENQLHYSANYNEPYTLGTRLLTSLLW
jgi:hypothetical protein